MAHKSAITSTSATITPQAISRPGAMGRILAWQTGQCTVSGLTCKPHWGQLITDGWVISEDRKSTRLNSSHPSISYAVFCLKKKKIHGNAHDENICLMPARRGCALPSTLSFSEGRCN